MGSLADLDTETDPFKILLIGHSGTGKTTSLGQLVKAGYQLRVADFDNGLQSLHMWLRENYPAGLERVDFMRFRDRLKPDGLPKAGSQAWIDFTKAMDQWEDGSKPAEWGAETVFVMDSLTMAGRAAFTWARALAPTIKDRRQWYQTAQASLSNVVSNITSDAFTANAVLITHIKMLETKRINDRGQEEILEVRGLPNTIGEALSKDLATWFNCVLVAETRVQPHKVDRFLRVSPTKIVEAKAPVPTPTDGKFPLKSGLLSVINHLKGTSS